MLFACDVETSAPDSLTFQYEGYALHPCSVYLRAPYIYFLREWVQVKGGFYGFILLGCLKRAM